MFKAMEEALKREDTSNMFIVTPSLAGGIVFLVLFSLYLVLLLFSSFRYHQWRFMIHWGIGLQLEIIGYAGRIWFHLNEASVTAYVLEYVCISAAAGSFIFALYFLYNQVVLIYYGNGAHEKAKLYRKIFLFSNITAVVLQSVGGGIASNGTESSLTTGNDLYIAGTTLQLFIFGIFAYIWFKFLYHKHKARATFGDEQFNPKFIHVRSRKLFSYFQIGLSLTILLFYVRFVYRVVKAACGMTSTVATKEIYFNIFEGLTMALSGLIMAILSPGVGYGKNAHVNAEKSEDTAFL